MPGNTIGEAYIQIKPSMEGVSDEITQALGGAADPAAKSFGSKLTGALGTVGKVGAAAVTAATAATGALVSGITASTQSLASYGDDIDKMSQKMGLSATAYQEWDAVLQHSGTSMESLKMGMKTLTGTLADAGSVMSETLAAELDLDNQLDSGAITLDEYNEAYDKLYESAYESLEPLSQLGFSMMEIEEMSQDSDLALEKVITALQGMPEGAERSALAQELLGRSAMEMGALLNTSAEDTQAMRDKVHELGGVLSDETVKSAAAFQDSMQDMQTALSGFSRSAVADFLPAFTSMMDGLSGVMTGDMDGGLEKITAGIDMFVASLTGKLPELLQVGMGIVQALASAIIENLPALVDAAIQLVGQLVTFIVENLPMIIDAGLQILLALADAIIDNLPTLIPAVVDVILTIVDKLTQPDMIVQLVNAALQIIIALAEGIIKALPQLIARVPEIIINIVKALVESLPMIFEAAVQLIGTLIEGIVSCFSQIIETGKNIIETVKDGVKQKIEDAKNWGKDLIKNFIEGIKGKWNDLKDSIKGVGDIIKDRMHFSVPDVGPLSDADKWAPDFMDLFASGIRNNIGLVTSAVDQMATEVGVGMGITPVLAGSRSSELASYQTAAPQIAAAGAGGGDIIIPVYVGNEKLDELVVRANQRANYRSGGR